MYLKIIFEKFPYLIDFICTNIETHISPFYPKKLGALVQNKLNSIVATLSNWPTVAEKNIFFSLSQVVYTRVSYDIKIETLCCKIMLTNDLLKSVVNVLTSSKFSPRQKLLSSMFFLWRWFLSSTQYSSHCLRNLPLPQKAGRIASFSAFVSLSRRLHL